MKKLIIFLLLLNFLSTVSVGYINYEANTSKKPTLLEIEKPITGDIEELMAGDREFKQDVYNGLTQLIMEQKMNTLRMFALHHFLKPHVEFKEGCPECEMEKQKILEEEKESVTSTQRITLNEKRL
jgi:hypothetical protein